MAFRGSSGRSIKASSGAECGSRALQEDPPNVHCEGVRATKHASRSPIRLLEDFHGLAEIVERGGGVEEERLAGQKLHSSRPPKPRELPVKVSLRHK